MSRTRAHTHARIQTSQQAQVREEALRLEALGGSLRPVRFWSAEQRAMAMGGAALFTILGMLTVTTVRARAEDVLNPSLHQMELNAQLFGRLMPHFASFPILYYAVFAWACVVALWLVYLRLIWQVRGRAIEPKYIAVGALILGVLAVTIPPVYSTDVFSYSIFGRLAAVYHVNPYLTTASGSAPGDLLMPYLYWRDIPSPYGPLWTLLSQVVAIGPHATPFDLTLRFKVIACLAVLIDGWLVYLLVKLRWPAQAGWTYLAFAWNPMVLIEGVVAAHNDVLILTVVLAAAYLLARSRGQLAMAALTVSGLVKYSTMPLVGVASLRLLLRTPVPKRAGLLLRLLLIGIALAILAFAPYWTGIPMLKSTLAEPGRGINNPPLMLFRWAVGFFSFGRIHASVVLTVALSLTAFTFWQLITLWRERSRSLSWGIDDELAAWATTLTVFLLLWPRIHTWYFILPFGLSLAAGPRHRRVFCLILLICILSYSSYAL